MIENIEARNQKTKISESGLGISADLVPGSGSALQDKHVKYGRESRETGIVGQDYSRLAMERNQHHELAQAYKKRIAELRKELWSTDFRQMAAKQAKIEQLTRKYEVTLEKVLDENFAVQGIRPKNDNNVRSPHSHRGVYTDDIKNNPQKEISYEYHATGTDKPTIICIPGVGVNGSMYHGVMRRIQEAANCVILDRFNQGYSSNSDEVVGFEQQVDEYTEAIKAIIIEKGITNYQLLGHSYGGNIARRVADNLDYWARCDSDKKTPKPSGVVSISSALQYGLAGTKKKDTTAPVSQFHAANHPRAGLAKFAHFPWLSYFKNKRKADGEARNKHAKKEESMLYKTHLVEGGQSNVPLSFISAEHDFIAPKSFVERQVHETRRTSPLYHVPGAAHSAMVTSAPQMALAVLQACGLDKEVVSAKDKKVVTSTDTKLMKELREESQVRTYLDDGNPYATPIQRTLLDAYYKAGNFGTRALAWLRNTLKV